MAKICDLLINVDKVGTMLYNLRYTISNYNNPNNLTIIVSTTSISNNVTPIEAIREGFYLNKNETGRNIPTATNCTMILTYIYVEVSNTQKKILFFNHTDANVKAGITLNDNFSYLPSNTALYSIEDTREFSLRLNNGQNMKSVVDGSTEYTTFPATISVTANKTLVLNGKDHIPM